MHAVVLREFGPAANLRYETVPDPEPGEGQVRIAVGAAGVHAVEAVIRSGVTTGLVPPAPELPAVFGGEVSGTVDATGPGVDPAWLGRNVVTASGSGGYAELTVADVSTLQPRPEGLTDEAAVAMTVTGTTALHTLDIAALTPDDVLLVNSAAGGIGRLVVQYARDLGATVIGAAGGPEKVAAVRARGAHLAVDYNEAGWEKTVAAWLAEEGGGRRVTAVLDGNGGDKARAAFELLGRGGRFLVIGAISGEPFEPGEALLAERGVSFVHALARMLESPGALDGFRKQALLAAADGKLVPDVETFPLARAAEAHAALEERRTTGKVVLIP